MLYRRAFADPGHPHHNVVAVGAVVPALPGVHDHQPAAAVLGKKIPPAVIEAGAGKGESADEGTHGDDAGHDAFHRAVGRIGRGNVLEPLPLEVGEGTHFALLHMKGALHTAADLFKLLVILGYRHDGQACLLYTSDAADEG